MGLPCGLFTTAATDACDCRPPRRARYCVEAQCSREDLEYPRCGHRLAGIRTASCIYLSVYGP
eukprot:5132722-Pyramimonas_sp.AAC.1